MFARKQLSNLPPKLLTVLLTLVVLLNSAANPTNAHALGVQITVTTISDNTNTDTVCSLREAITNANNNSATYPDCGSGLANDVIVFDDALGTDQIALSSTLPDITDTWGLTINGGGDITINGTGHRVFVNFNTGAALKLNGLAVIFGTATFNINNFLGGGGIVNVGTLIITNSTFSNNYAASLNLDHGAAIDNEWGSVSITNSTFANNEAHYGGAIYNASGATANITNSTFTQNDAFPDPSSSSIGGFGGAIYNSGIMNLKNNTISGNPATANRGGGIYNGLGGQTVLNLFNNIIANNTGGDCVNASTIAGNNNLIESTASNACALTNGISGNVIGSDPNLGLLTGSPAYLPLLAGSMAINAGDDSICVADPVNNTSQNGVPRPQGSHCDIGSFEITISTLPFNSIDINDGWILESSETSGVGGTMDSTATTFNLGDDLANKQYRAILHFNTSSLPDTAVITSATLKIKKYKQTGSDPFTILGGLKVDMRKPSFGTSALALTDFKSAAGKGNVATFGATPLNSWYSAALNSAGNLYINRTGSTQFRIFFTTDDNNNHGNDYMKFYSGNAGAANRPQLVIEYYVP